jgi:nitrogen fixation protein FixH
MQNLHMMATLIREQQMQKMAIEINKGLLNIEEAMVQYNVSTKEAVLIRVENLKEDIKHKAANNQPETVNLNVLAA